MTLYTYLESDLGQMLATSSEGKLSGLYFVGQKYAPEIGRDWVRRDDEEIFAQTARELAEYSSGKRRKFELPIGLNGTPFQVRVWEEIYRIPFGQTISYGELAARAGKPDAVRAAGTATGRNPICWIVPCHRVVGKDGGLTGFAGGLDRKRAYLDFEAGRSVGLVMEAELATA
jgi:methylated-DNA-[protein]-cysteine S-methyltransferase